MKKKLYYFYNLILPDSLILVLLTLLFYLLNFKIEIVNSLYVIFFGVCFSLLHFVFIMVLNKVQVNMLKKMSIKDLMLDKNNKLIIIMLLFKVISIVLMFLSMYIAHLFFKDYIIINEFYILIIFVVIVEIIRFLLNKMLKFDTILIGDDQVKFDKIFEELNKVIDSNEIDDKIEEEKIQQSLEKMFEELEKRKKELEENKDDELKK